MDILPPHIHLRSSMRSWWSPSLPAPGESMVQGTMREEGVHNTDSQAVVQVTYMRDTSVSSALWATGDTLTNTSVLELPPRLSWSSIVNLLFLKESPRSCLTFPLSTEPVCLEVMVRHTTMMRWERELSTFILVAAVWRLFHHVRRGLDSVPGVAGLYQLEESFEGPWCNTWVVLTANHGLISHEYIYGLTPFPLLPSSSSSSPTLTLVSAKTSSWSWLGWNTLSKRNALWPRWAVTDTVKGSSAATTCSASIPPRRASSELTGRTRQNTLILPFISSTCRQDKGEF
ncbi:hypothetical protein E2C01_030660 [Portunus trituberculatus]|uniref:Uncharacterized protein n=1 Tax=Portunus trituberculatus TaxID=210409 RepID=A0A5B7EVF5_PORTR|nr:hypothetical protein [Portunus trituberculatus]